MPVERLSVRMQLRFDLSVEPNEACAAVAPILPNHLICPAHLPNPPWPIQPTWPTRPARPARPARPDRRERDGHAVTSFTVIVYLNASGSRLSSRPLAVSPC